MARKLIIDGKLHLMGPVGGSFWDEDSGFSDTDVAAALAEMKGDIDVVVNSGGGLAMQGAAIYNLLKRHDGAVNVTIVGLAASAASLIAMAGDKIEMPLGSMMMIHDPAVLAMGSADELRKTASVLDTMAGVFAEVYADRSGLDEAEVRQIMKDETWMSPAQAVEKGFATAEIEGEAATADASFDYGSYRNAPASLKALAQNRQAEGLPMVAVATAPVPLVERTTKMTKAIEAAVAPVVSAVAPASTEPVLAAPKDNTKAIFDRCLSANMSMAEANAVIEAAGNSLEKASDIIINKLADQDPDGGVRPVRATVLEDGRDRFKQGASLSLLAKVGLGGERNEFSSMTLRELARAALEQSGVKVSQFSDPMMMVGAALGMNPNIRMAAGMHSTSDYVEILANVANKAMLKGYDEAQETFDAWTARGTLSDFKVVKRIDANLFPALAEVPEGAEYSYATMGERAASIQLATYGKMYAITRQAIINDDLNVFGRVPMKMGRAARRTVGNLVYAVLTSNAAMADGITLFHADHNNLASVAGAPTVATFSAGRSKMALQQDPDEHATGGLNIRPKYALVPVTLEGATRVLVASEFDPAATQRKPNEVRGMVEVIADARLDTASTATWYLAADPMMHDTIEVAYLNGNSSPVMEQQNGWHVDGVEFKVRLDAGVSALDFRGLYKNAG